MEVIMARAEQKARIGEIQNQSNLSPALLQSTCVRCGGLMVNEISMDLMNSTSELECATKRCVQCGDILDPVILRNRRIRQEPMTVEHAGNSLRSISSIEHR
jgi:hypothetical protein